MVIRDAWIRALVIVVLAIAVLYLAGLVWQVASQFADIILLFFLAWVVAFILEPVVVFLRLRGRLPRPLAVTVAYLGLLVVLAWAIVWLVPPFSSQVVQVVVDLPTYISLVNGQIEALQGLLEERGLSVNLASILNYDDLARRAEAMAPPILSNAVALATRIASFVLQLTIVLMLSFYVMLDGHRISHGLLQTVPIGFRDDVAFFFASVNRAFAGFLRGQLIQALIYSLGVAAIMWAIGLDLVLLTAVVNTLCMLIPFVGPPLALIMPLAVAYFESPGSFWLAFVLVNALQAVVLNVVAPRVMSSAIGLHPLLVFVGLLGGARVAGFWGALFGVPVVAVIAAMVSFYHAMLQRRASGSELPIARSEPEVVGPEAPAFEPEIPSPRRRPSEVGAGSRL
jgi:predicted PurR-regulated permease PerM